MTEEVTGALEEIVAVVGVLVGTVLVVGESDRPWLPAQHYESSDFSKRVGWKAEVIPSQG